MIIRCPICDQPVTDYTSDELNGALHSESYQCEQRTHRYQYEFVTGNSREHIKTHSLDITTMTHYTDPLDVSLARQSALKQVIVFAQKEHTADKPLDTYGKD